MNEQSESIAELVKALVAASLEFPPIPKNGRNTYFKKQSGEPSHYVLLDDAISLTTPILAKNGIAVSQQVVSDGDYLGVRTKVCHVSGQWQASTALIRPAKLGDAQAAGSVITYFRRYQYLAALNLETGDDDDANHASGKQSDTPKVITNDSPIKVGNMPLKPPRQETPKPNPAKAGEPISEPQAKRLFAISNAKGWTHEELKEVLRRAYGVTSTRDILRANYDEICNVVGNKTYKQAVKELDEFDIGLAPPAPVEGLPLDPPIPF